MTDEQESKPSETPEASATPEETPTEAVAVPVPRTDVVNVGAGARDDDDDEDFDEEPADATRVSPHAIAGFVLSLLALYHAPRDVFTIQTLQMSQFIRLILPTFAVPVLGAFGALYLAMRGEREIFEADGKLGGLGYVRGTRIVAILILFVAVLAVVLVAFFTEAPQQVPQFG